MNKVLPKGWCVIKMNELASHKSGNSKLIKGKLHSTFDDRHYSAFSATGQDVWHDKYEFEGLALIISAVGARCGKVFQADGKWSAIANTHIVWPNEHLVDYHFFWYLINNENFWDKGGTAQPFVKVKNTFCREIELPPLPEQKRIAAKLEKIMPRIDALKERLDRIPQIIKRFRQSVLIAAVTGKLTEDWREGKNYQCENTNLGTLSEYITSGSRGWAKYYSSSGAIFVRAQNINTDKLELNEIAYVKLPKKVEGKRTQISKDDILITITGANVTKTAQVTINLEEAYVNQHVALVKLNNKNFASYLYLWLISPIAGRLQLEKFAYGAGKPGLNLQNIKDVVVMLPPLEEQKEIVRQVNELFAFADKLEAHYKKAKEKIDKLPLSVLAKTFRGELVPHDPNDEPASELLKKIIVEKEKRRAEIKKMQKRNVKATAQKKGK